MIWSRIVRPLPKQVRLDRVFSALADPTRRAVLQRLGKGPSAVSELAQGFEMTLPSFTQHLNVLAECGPVRSRKKGRVRTYEISPAPLALAEGWLREQRSVWESRLDRLDAYLTSKKDDRS